MSEDYSYTAIAAFVPDPYCTRIATTSRLLGEKWGSWFVLNERRFPPHVTMWIAYVPSRNIRLIKEAAAAVLRSVQPFGVDVCDAKMESSGYVSLEVELTESLRTIHSLLLERLNPLREGYLAEKYVQRMDSFSSEQQRSLRLYGTRAAGELFRPHVTVGAIGAEVVVVAREQLTERLRDLAQTSFTAREITLFRQGEEGKSIEVLGRYALGPCES